MRYLLVLLLLAGAAAQCQQRARHGTIAVRGAGTPVSGALVRVTLLHDTTTVAYAFSDSAGRFVLAALDSGLYTLEVRHVGYAPFARTQKLEPGNPDVGVIAINPRTIAMEEVLSQERAAIVVAGDTVEFIASAFLRDPDEGILELLERLPGATVRDGVIRIRGEEITRILVDGQPLFGPVFDKNLGGISAGDVSTLRVYRGFSDQEDFSGFSDGEGAATLNIVTKRRGTKYLKTQGGLGESGRYRGNIDWGQSDSVDQAFLGVGSARLTAPSGSGSIVSNHTLYGRILEGWESSSVSGAYYFTNSESENRRSTMRKSFPVDGVELGYTEATAFRSLSNSHGLGLRGEFRFDSLNTILITPNLSSSRLHSPQSRSAMTTWDDSTTFSRISSSDDPVTTGTQLSGSLLWGHRFELPGRTFSVELKAGSDGSSASSILRREADAVGGGIPARDTLYQMRSDTRRSRRISGRAIYTEPLTAESRVAIDYQIRNSSDMSDTWTRSGSTLSEADANPDPASSGEMTEQIFSQRVGFGMQQQFGPLQMTAMLSHDLSRLRGEGTRPGTASASATYSTFLPRLRLKYAPGGGTSWELVILSDRNLPSIGELQEVIDNSNPLLLKKGNPDLRQSVGHGIKVTSTWGQGRASSHISIRASVARDVLGQSTFVLPRDSITSSGLRLLRGTQIVEPYNGGRSWRIEGDGYWYTPLISDYLHLTFLAKVSYSTQPWKWNDREYSSSSVALRPDITLLVSPNEDLWIRLGYQPDIHSTWGGSNGSTLRHIGSHEGDFTARWSVVKGVELKNSVRMRYDPAIPSSVSNDWITWNMECTVKLPGVKGGELLVGFYDILDRGRALERRISESFVEERSAMTYGRYLMLNLRYGWM